MSTLHIEIGWSPGELDVFIFWISFFLDLSTPRTLPLSRHREEIPLHRADSGYCCCDQGRKCKAAEETQTELES